MFVIDAYLAPLDVIFSASIRFPCMLSVLFSLAPCGLGIVISTLWRVLCVRVRDALCSRFICMFARVAVFWIVMVFVVFMVMGVWITLLVMVMFCVWIVVPDIFRLFMVIVVGERVSSPFPCSVRAMFVYWIVRVEFLRVMIVSVWGGVVRVWFVSRSVILVFLVIASFIVWVVYGTISPWMVVSIDCRVWILVWSSASWSVRV